MRFIVYIAVIVCVAAAVQAADSVVFKDGSKVNGIVRKSDGKVIIETKHFGTITVPEAAVDRIFRDEPVTAETAGDISTKPYMQDEPSVIAELVRFVPGSIIRSKEPAKYIAIRTVKLSGTHRIHTKTFETMLINAIARGTGYRMIERDALDVLLKEQQMSLTGLTAEDSAKIGKLIGVDAFLDVKVVSENADTLTAEMRLVTVEKGTVCWQDTFTGKVKHEMKWAVGACYSPAGTFTYNAGSIAGNEGHPYFNPTLEYAGATGQLGGVSVRMNQQLWFTRLFDIGLIGSVIGDFSAHRGEMKAYPDVVDAAGTNCRHNVGIQYTGFFSADIMFIGKFYFSELFATSMDVVRIYGGAGVIMGMWSFTQTNTFSSTGTGSIDPSQIGSRTVGMPGASVAALAGLEIRFIDSCSLFVECLFPFSTEYEAGFNRMQDRPRYRIRAGLLWNIFN